MTHLIDRLQLVGPPGSSTVMAGELSRLCRRALDDYRMPRAKKLGTGAVVIPFEARVAMVALHYHRTSSRVLWDLYASRARTLDDLYSDLVSAVRDDGRRWIEDGHTLSIRPRNLQGFPAGVRQVVGAVKNAIIDGARARGVALRVATDGPDRLLAVRRHDETVTVSVDLGDGSQHQRGYRIEAGPAPLRENLAAVLLMLARYDPRRDVLVDPMAGSGTIAIEAALMAAARPLQPRPRSAASWPLFDDVRIPDGPLFADARPRVRAIEIDSKVARMARNNAERAGVGGVVEVIASDFRQRKPVMLQAQEQGLILTNPPYGRRLDSTDLGDLHRQFRDWCQAAPGYRVGVLIEDAHYEKRFGARPRMKKPLSNAGVNSYFYLFDPLRPG